MSLFVRVGMLFFFDDYFKYNFFFSSGQNKVKIQLST